MNAPTLTRRQACMVLNSLPDIGPVTVRRLMQALGDEPAAIFSASEKTLKSVSGIDEKRAHSILHWQKHFDLEREERLLAEHGGQFIIRGDPAYPPLLHETYDPPIGLYSKSGYKIGAHNVAIVGSRRTTLYGQSVAGKLAAGLARAGFCVVSGLARGIDSAAHKGALEVGGATAGVLGCGLDVIYPLENRALYKEVAEQGALLSEFPFGRRPDRQTFPMRNRLVAGICRGVIVVESDSKGGSMITARFAMEQNRQVFAVPGRIDQPSSRGCHDLIRDGAVLVRKVEDVLEELQWPSQPELSFDDKSTAPQPANLSGDEAAVYDALQSAGMQKLDTLAGLCGFPIPKAAAALLMLELKNRVVKRADGSFEAR